VRFDAVPLEVAGAKLFVRYSLGAMLILQRRMSLTSLSEVLDKIQGVLPEAAPEGQEGETAAAAAAIQDKAFRTNLDDLAEVLWAGLFESGVATHYRTPTELMCALPPGDLARVLTAIGAATALGFARPESEAADAGNPLAAAPSPSA
jgi:hypothetical protein